jgi:hypothetical protein
VILEEQMRNKCCKSPGCGRPATTKVGYCSPCRSLINRRWYENKRAEDPDWWRQRKLAMREQAKTRRAHARLAEVQP